MTVLEPQSRPGGVVITGSSGIAAAAARQLADRGRDVFVISRTESSCAELVTGLGARGAGWAAVDLQDEVAAVRAFDAAERSLGRVDGVIAVAGGSGRRLGDGPLHDLTLQAWDATLALNLTTIFLTTREAVRRMRGRGGSIVLTSSVLATSPQPGGFTTHAYAAAKAA